MRYTFRTTVARLGKEPRGFLWLDPRGDWTLKVPSPVMDRDGEIVGMLTGLEATEVGLVVDGQTDDGGLAADLCNETRRLSISMDSIIMSPGPPDGRKYTTGGRIRGAVVGEPASYVWSKEESNGLG